MPYYLNSIGDENTSEVDDFNQILRDNKNIVIVKFTATWCGPCNQIKDYVDAKMNELPAEATCIILDVDNHIDLYGKLKTMKIVNGIPSLLMYIQKNTTLLPDEVVIGTDMPSLEYFFQRAQSFSYVLIEENQNENSST
jgi:thiol-disulfide isomerase/thioredoxin